MTDVKVTILGCGPSEGVPGLLSWGKCNPEDQRNRRLRSSAMISVNNVNFLLDASPDLRHQFQRENIKYVDAVILSHYHYDHMAGLLDLFFLSRQLQKKIPIFADTETIGVLKRVFPFMFDFEKFGFIAQIIAFDGHDIFGFDFHFFRQKHGKIQSLGIRLGDFAYSIDASDIEEKELDKIKGVRTWVLPARYYASCKNHAGLDKALNWVTYVKPERAYLINLGQEMDFTELSRVLPDGIEACVDGMTIDGVYKRST